MLLASRTLFVRYFRFQPIDYYFTDLWTTGAQALVSGSGFSPTATVDILFDKILLAQLVTGTGGKFSKVPIQRTDGSLTRKPHGNRGTGE